MFCCDYKASDERPVGLLAPMEGGAVVVAAVIGDQEHVARGQGVQEPAGAIHHPDVLHLDLPVQATPCKLSHVVHTEHLPPEGEAPADRLPLHLLHLKSLSPAGAGHGEGH